MSFYAGCAINSLIFILIYVPTFAFCTSRAAQTSKYMPPYKTQRLLALPCLRKKKERHPERFFFA